MMRIVPSVLMAALLLLVWGAGAQTTATKKRVPVKKSTPTKSSSAKKAPTRSAVSIKKGPAKKGAAPKTPAVTWRNRQLSPSADRYREIQSALAAKGYMRSEHATGTWNQDSTDALKRFQQDQNLDPSGKINSLSLIALGLGPKHDTSAVVTPPKPPQ